MTKTKLALLAFALSASLAAGGLFAPVAAQTAPAPNAVQRQADITFWTSIKDSKNADEFKAYLEAFPSGVFAPLARLRIKQLAAGSGTPAPTSRTPPAAAQPSPSTPPAVAQPRPSGPPEPEGGPPPSGAPSAPPSRAAQPTSPPPPPASSPPSRSIVDYTNREFMISLQEKLYNLNYDIERFTGVLDQDTYKAIVAVQRALRQAQNGELTDHQWREIERSRVSTTWGAIAYNANATHSYAFSRATRRDAEDAARSACKRRAGRNAKCSVMTAKDTQCIAMAKYRQRWGSNTHFGVRVYRAGNMQRAEDNAMQQCQNVERSRGNCQMVRTFCANGSHGAN